MKKRKISILVVSTRDTCEHCECIAPDWRDDSLYACAVTCKSVPIDGGNYGPRPAWCPMHDLSPWQSGILRFLLEHKKGSKNA